MATSWSKRWHNFAQYRPILEAAHKGKVPVVALNAESETIRQVVHSGGVERVPAEVRMLRPELCETRSPRLCET